MSASPPAIEFDALTKRYGDRVAVERLRLRIKSGSIFCLLGRNGAGKTTALHTIMGLRTPTAGDVRIQGLSVGSPRIHAVRRAIGYVPELPVLYEDLTGREFLQFVGQLHRISPDPAEKIDAQLARFRMCDHADARIGTYSMGMKKRIAFLAALLPGPEILILDEPTGALDAMGAREVKKVMVEYREKGRLVLFTTHIMEIAERLSDRIAILHEGSLRFEGVLAHLRTRHGHAPTEPLEEIFVRLTEPSGPDGPEPIDPPRTVP